MSNRALEAWVWALIYGGLLMLLLGVFVMRGDAAFGWTLVVLGSVVAVVGAALIFVRARRGPDR